MILTLFSKTIILPIIILSPLMAASMSSMISLWMIMELSSFMFIALTTMDNNNLNKMEASLMYFLIQSITSTMLIMIMMMTKIMHMNMSALITITIMAKLGASPFHSWVPWVMMNLSWNSCFFLTSFQKVIPLVMLNMFMNKSLFVSVSLLTAMVSSMMIMKSNLMKEIMAYSSISHTPWMLMITMISPNYLAGYLMVYFSITWAMFNMLESLSVKMNSDLSKMIKLKWFKKLMFITLLLSMGSMPPLTGFLLKMIAITSFKMWNATLIMLIMLSMVNLFVYLRISGSTLMCFSSNSSTTTFVVYNSKMTYSNLMVIATITFMLMYNMILM